MTKPLGRTSAITKTSQNECSSAGAKKVEEVASDKVSLQYGSFNFSPQKARAVKPEDTVHFRLDLDCGQRTTTTGARAQTTTTVHQPTENAMHASQSGVEPANEQLSLRVARLLAS